MHEMYTPQHARGLEMPYGLDIWTTFTI